MITINKNSGGWGIYQLFRYAANFVIAAGWLWAFQTLGWISFQSDLPLWQTLGITALFAWIIMFLSGVVYIFFVMATCGVGCLLFPLYFLAVGFIALYGVAETTHLFTFNPELGLWTYALMSVAFGLGRIPDVTPSTSTTTTSVD